jgi:hypothetical protein
VTRFRCDKGGVRHLFELVPNTKRLQRRQALWEAVCEHKPRGVVAKKRRGRFHAGRVAGLRRRQVYMSAALGGRKRSRVFDSVSAWFLGCATGESAGRHPLRACDASGLAQASRTRKEHSTKGKHELTLREQPAASPLSQFPASQPRRRRHTLRKLLSSAVVLVAALAVASQAAAGGNGTTTYTGQFRESGQIVSDVCGFPDTFTYLGH